MTSAILDANLLVLYSIGSRHPELLGKHKRVKEYMPEDYDLLLRLVGNYAELVVTPNAVTECSDLLKDTAADDDAKDALRELVCSERCRVAEEYVPSPDAMGLPQYRWLGVADCAMLSLVGPDTVLLSMDRKLVIEAQKINHDSINFNHCRDFT